METVLLVAVIAMIIWRQSVARKEDDSLHVLHGAISEQTTVATKLEKIDKWGKTLTAITIAVGLLIFAAWVYQTWIQGVPPGAK